MSIEVKKFFSPFIEENTYIVIDCESNVAAVIDPGILSSDIESLLSQYELKFILLTHAHGDHIKDIGKYMSLYPEAKVVVGIRDYDYLNNPSLNGTVDMPIDNVSVEADITTSDGDVLEFGKTSIKVISTPGHTPGGQCFLIEDILFSGDTLFFMSVGATHFVGGDFGVLSSSIVNKLFTLDDSIKVLPGHGPETSIGYEKRANPFV